MTKNTKTVIILLIIAVLIAVIPVAALRGAEFGGSDDAGSVMVEEIHGEYEPWFTPVLETALQGTSGRTGKSALLCADWYRRGSDSLFYGAFCGAEKMDDEDRRRR